MQRFSYDRPASVGAALAAGREADAAFYAGGTTLVDLMKLDVAAPRAVIDINHLALASIEANDDRLRLGALVRMSDAADSAAVKRAAPAVVAALEASASAQLRNMASLGGNLMQRTRCAYFRDVQTGCNKRRHGSGCAARTGMNEEHAILGTSEHCIAVHASDLAVALRACGAVLNIEGPLGAYRLPIADLYREPGETPEIETALQHGELIVSIDVPCSAAAANSTYLKVRDRTSYAFALTSCAAGIAHSADGTIVDVCIALGGVGTVPWRAYAAEKMLRGKRPGSELFAQAARAVFEDARPTTQNSYKIDLGIRTMIRALEAVSA